MEEAISTLPPDMQSVLWVLAFDIAVVAVVVVALLTTAKHAWRLLDGGGCLDRPIAQVVLEVAPLVLGALVAMVPGLFAEFDPALRAVFGLIAGYMSPAIYGHIKRRLPWLVLSKDAPARGGDDD